MSYTEWALWGLVLIAQNFAFTFVSRARNSASLKRHLLAAIASNGVWFTSQILIFSQIYAIVKGEKGLLAAVATGAYYTAFTLTGSMLSHYWALSSEQGAAAVGANKKYAQIPAEEWAAVKEKVMANA